MDNLKQFAEAVGADIKRLSSSTPSAKPKKFKINTHEPSGIYPIVHNSNTQNVFVFVYDTNNQQVLTDVSLVDANTINIIVLAGIDLTGYKVLVIG